VLFLQDINCTFPDCYHQLIALTTDHLLMFFAYLAIFYRIVAYFAKY